MIKKENSPVAMMAPPHQSRSSSSTAADEDVKTGFLFSTIHVPVAVNIRRNSPSPNMDPSAMKALHLLKGQVKKVVDGELNRLRSSRHLAFEPVADLAQRLEEEKDKLKHVLRKATEKQGSYERAVAEYDKSRAVVVSAGDEGGPHLNQDLNVGQKSFQNICESLVNSWKEDVDLAKKRVVTWDFKSKRQHMMVSKAQKELTAAEAKYQAQGFEIDSEMENLRALYTFFITL